MKSMAGLRKWVLIGLGVGAVVSALLGALPIGDYGKGLALNLATELAGALVTYVLLQLVIGRREEQEATKAALIAQMGSQVQDVAVAAAEELWRYGWLHDGSLQGAILLEANLQGARLYGANLEGTDLFGANLQEATLFGANLRRANLYGVNLQRARLIRANLQRASLDDANLQGANLQGAILDEYTTLPDGTKWTSDTDMARFTDPDHPDFWRPDA